jgi:hypothetical protein
LFQKGHLIDAKEKSKVDIAPCQSGTPEALNTLQQYL